jgi:uncharacterized membrane protein (UPF0127 family)
VARKNKRTIVIVAMISIIALALFILRPLLFDTKPTLSGGSGKAITVEPQFAHEGVLVFLNTNQDTLRQVDIEIADTNIERNQGMMYRSSMSYDRAMLFIMEYEKEQSFWMRNTKMSLDIIYVDGNMEIVTIYKHTQPFSDSPIPSFKRAKYVVETSAGFCDQYGIVEGNRIAFTRFE